MDKPFELVSDFSPAGHQPAAIEGLIDGLDSGLAHQVLLGVTALSWKKLAFRLILHFNICEALAITRAVPGL